MKGHNEQEIGGRPGRNRKKMVCLGGVVLLILAVVGWCAVGGGGLFPWQPVGRTVGGLRVADPVQEKQAQFVADVLADTNLVWGRIFHEIGRGYRPPDLVLLTGEKVLPCAQAYFGEAERGYCRENRTLYFGLSRPGTSGQGRRPEGQARALAHLVGHHIQDQLGIIDKARASGMDRIALRLELQAECLAGIWSRRTVRFKELTGPEPPDATAVASAISGTPGQRSKWFARGYEFGDLWACNTLGKGKL